MASIKDLRQRITTVKNTQQTTRAMKMVSAAKLRRAQDAIVSQRPYAKRMAGLIDLMVSQPDAQMNSPLLAVNREGEAGKKKLLLVLVTSDRGLCGSFNAGVIKLAQRYISENQSLYDVIELGFVGRRGADFFKARPVAKGPNWAELGGKVTYAKARKLGSEIVQYYLDGKADEVKFIYNEFKNAATQIATVQDLLPLRGVGSSADASAVQPSTLIVKPSPTEVLEALLSKHFGVQAFRVLLESQAGEHGSRMSAMENATKNAGEMIKKLTLQYNKQRQGNITKELLEIISGSESQKTA